MRSKCFALTLVVNNCCLGMVLWIVYSKVTIVIFQEKILAKGIREGLLLPGMAAEKFQNLQCTSSESSLSGPASAMEELPECTPTCKISFPGSSKIWGLDTSSFEKNEFFKHFAFAVARLKTNTTIDGYFGKFFLLYLLISQYLYNCISLLNNTWGGRGCTQIITWIMIYQDHKASTIS